MNDDILGTSLLALIAAVAIAAGLSAAHPSAAASSGGQPLEVVMLPTVVVTGKRETAVPVLRDVAVAAVQ